MASFHPTRAAVTALLALTFCVFISFLVFKFSVPISSFLVSNYKQYKHVKHDVPPRGDIIFDFVSPLSMGKGKSGRNRIKSVQEVILKVLRSRNVSDFISPNFKDNSVRLEWPTQHLVVKKPPIALIMVTSTAEAKLQRTVIRESWKMWSENYNVKVVFYMGLPKTGDLYSLFVESSTFDDIVIDDFHEDFYALPIKVLRMFKWFLNFYGGKLNPTNKVNNYENVHERSAKPFYLIKADHDVFLHIPNIVAHLNSLDEAKSPSRHSYMAGALHLNSKVTRKKTSKYFTPPHFWQGETYPPFLGGPVYILHSDLVGPIFSASFKTPLFHLEDVYITGMIANQTLGIELTHLGSDVVIESARGLREVLRFKNKIWKPFAYHGVGKDTMHYLFQIANRHIRSITIPN